MSLQHTLSHSFHLRDSSDGLGKNAIIELLSKRIAEMLQFETDLLFSTLYRLDVFESKITEVIQGRTSDFDIATGLARLVVERQEEKNIARANYQSGQGEQC